MALSGCRLGEGKGVSQIGVWDVETLPFTPCGFLLCVLCGRRMRRARYRCLRTRCGRSSTPRTLPQPSTTSSTGTPPTHHRPNTAPHNHHMPSPVCTGLGSTPPFSIHCVLVALMLMSKVVGRGSWQRAAVASHLQHGRATTTVARTTGRNREDPSSAFSVLCYIDSIMNKACLVSL